MRGRVALSRIRELGVTLTAPAGERTVEVSASPVPPVRIEFDSVSFTYATQAGDEEGFTLGPIDLSIASGEVVFVTGGNGSGKSTLVRLLTGLYAPRSGQIRLNGCAIDDSSREQYRQNFTAVFADYYLFDRLFGVDALDRSAEIQQYLVLLGMDKKVRVLGDRFTTTALSSGQRRRLALLAAYLEDRPVYVFDEWAADQDPSYKEIFYLRLLPELQARGKCVIVITHDDRYFRYGDRVLKLEAGRIVDEQAGRGNAIKQAHIA
jgi:putative ATP-binding cassette transporter